MYPASFAYHRARSLKEALDLLGEHAGAAKFMAGGHSLVPAMKLRMAQPGHVIDIAGIDALRGIRVEGDRLTIGAATTHWEIESSMQVREFLPVLCEAAGVIADPQVRNRGTIGGSLVNADPAADWPASALAFDAEMICVSRRGIRSVPATQWFEGLLSTALSEDELLQEIRFPRLPAKSGAVYLKLPHPASRFALAGVAVAITLNGEGTGAEARIGITGVAEKAFRASAAEEILRTNSLDAAAIAAACELLYGDVEISGDMHFTSDDKRDLGRAITGEAISTALKRARLV